MKLSLSNVLKTLLFALSSITFVVGVGLGTYYIINNSKKNEVIASKPGNREIVDLKKSTKTPVALIEHETNGSYFLGLEGLEELNSRIINELNFGPEIGALKSIRINNLSILGEGVSGQYNPFTQEMEISISRYIKPFKNIPISEKIDLIFQTIIHEYGHHFANTYITSIATNDPRNSRKLFSKYGNKSAHKNINKTFLNAFENSLHYSDTEMNNALSKDKSSVGSAISARDLYLKSNNIDIKNSDQNNFLGIDDYRFSSELPFENKKFLYTNDSSWYSYLFSIDELLTRKLQQISYIDTINGKTIANKSTQFTGTIIEGSLSASTFAGDISKNRKIIWKGSGNNKAYEISEDLKMLDDPFGGKFTNSENKISTIDSTVQELWKAYFDVAGYEYGISQIFMKNTSFQKNANTRSAILPKDFDQIKLSGYLKLDESKNYKSIILTKKDASKLSLEFEKNDYEYKWLKAKTNMLSKNATISKEKNMFGYVTDYFSFSTIDTSKPLKVWNDINKDGNIDRGEEESLTVPPTRPVTTFRESFVKTFADNSTYRDADVVGNNFYEIISLENEAYLQLYSIIDDKLQSRSLFSNIWDTHIFVSDNINIPNGVIMINNNQRKSEK
ncbi:MAG: hypothetical protein KFW07_02810 [Mycoplasmataceae bacterium]|nr:hypothetical protein [Mycoplasmataceae bacterium]